MNLDDRLAVVTGAGSGLGRGIAVMLAERGASVAAIDLDGNAAAQTAEMIRAAGGSAGSYAADVTDSGAVDGSVSAAVSDLGPLEIMVNNAGVLDAYLDVHELDETLWRRVVDIDLTGVFIGCKRALDTHPQSRLAPARATPAPPPARLATPLRPATGPARDLLRDPALPRNVLSIGQLAVCRTNPGPRQARRAPTICPAGEERLAQTLAEELENDPLPLGNR